MSKRATCDPSPKTVSQARWWNYPSLMLLILLVGVGLSWFGYSNFYTPGLEGTLRGHQGWVLCVAFAPDGKTLVTGGQDGSVRLWDSSTRKERAIMTGHTAKVVDVAFSPDGKLVASASWDGSVRLWDTGTGRERAALQAKPRQKDNGKPLPIFTVAFSPNGQVLASAGSDQSVRLWDLATGQERAVFQDREDICSLAITKDGKLLVSRTEHGIIIVRELDGGKELRRFGEW